MKALERGSGGRGSSGPDRKIRVPKNALLVRFFLHPVGKAFLGLIALTVIAAGSAFAYYYLKYAKVIDEKKRLAVNSIPQIL